MKVKELLRTVNVAWSPLAQHPILLAAGTAAQQLDASFSTSASLDLYALGLQDPGYEMELRASISSDNRYHKIIWGSYGNNPAGIIVGGCDYGTIKIYSAAKMLANENNCILSSPDKHTGPVRAMDFNPFQSNLLATGATESEIYIWDLVNTGTPMTPGTRSQPLEDVQYIAWNKQVQHILASTFSQRCVIWDLRKNEPIIKLSDANSRVRWKVVQWHPEVATQLCLASEDDQTPIIQLWDLRFATSPLKTLEGHQRGVLSIAWNLHDPDLLISCAKDNRILCWNPNSTATNGEILCELAQTNQWNFDVSWCPRNPALVVGSSFDGHAVVYSLLGGQQQPSAETTNKIADSFPGMDSFAQAPPIAHTESAVDLKRAPKWLKRPVGASFGFGGKLIFFENEAPNSNAPNTNGRVIVSQVITNPEMIHRSNHLEAALQNGQFGDFCKGKADTANDEHSRKVWNCLGAHFGDNVTRDVLELLGYSSHLIHTKLGKFIPEDPEEICSEVGPKLNNVPNGNTIDGSAAFDAIAQQEQIRRSPVSVKPAENNFKINTGDDEEGLITQAILLGNIEAAVSLCFSNKRYADAVILSMAGGADLLAKTQYRYFSEHSSALNSLINSLVSEDWGDIVNNCDIKCWKEALVGVFTHSNPEERTALCDALGDRLASSDDPLLKRESQLCYICSGNLNKMIQVSEEDVQEVAELVTIMQKVLESQGVRDVQIEGNIADLLSQYGEMLAAEGNLEAALIYLGNSQEKKISALRDRLCKALGYIQQNTQQAKPRPSIPNSQNYYNQSRKPQQPVVPQQTAYDPARTVLSQNNWNTTPTKQSYGPSTNQFGSSPHSGQIGPIPTQPVQSTFPDQYATHSYGQLPAVPAVQPPPPPPTMGSNPTGSRPSSVGPQSRSKYILDPSVKTSSFGSPYNNQNSFAPATQIYNNQPQSQVTPAQGFPPQSSFQTQTAIPPNFYTNQQPQPQNPVYNHPVTDISKSSQPNLMNTVQNSAQTSLYNPTSAPPPPSQVPTFGADISYQHSSQQSGWNDPPNASTTRAQPLPAFYSNNVMSAEHAGSRRWKAKHSNSDTVKAKADSFQPQNPILHPIFGTTPQQEPVPNLMNPENVYTNTHAQLPYGQQQQYGQQQVYGLPQNIPSQFNPPQEAVQSVQTARIAEPEKPKAPIPEEHVHLKTVLDEVKTQCYNNAKNPQIKRKIEEVSRKLEVLYDCLRENKLSPNTLAALHQMSQMIQSGNYTGGLALHTQLVSGSDFSQIASFMPGLKVLLQSALQLGVYIR